MMRPFLTELLLFLLPFAVYAGYLLGTRAGVLKTASWPPRILITLTICALVLMIISFFFLAHFFGEPAGSNYVPPHMEDGKLVPGQFK